MGKGQSASIQSLPVPEVAEQSLSFGAQLGRCSECINLKEQVRDNGFLVTAQLFDVHIARIFYSTSTALEG